MQPASSSSCSSSMPQKQDVGGHYDNITNKAIERGVSSKPFLIFNSTAKSWLFRTYSPKIPFNLMEFCCGRGGDLMKWSKTKAKYICGIDISEESVEEARRRHRQVQNTMPGEFHAFDCFAPDFQIPGSQGLPRVFEVVSCMLALHYSFRDEATARTALANVARHLTPGGIFLVTTVDANVLLYRANQARTADPATAKIKFGNSEYQIIFEADPVQVTPQNPFGHRYLFHLDNHVEGLGEYVVLPSVLVDLAQSVGLQPLLDRPMNFCHDIAKALDRPTQNRIWNPVPPPQREVVELYCAYVFQKTV